MSQTRQPGSPTDSLALVARVLALAALPGEDALADALAGEAAQLLQLPLAAVTVPPAGTAPAPGALLIPLPGTARVLAVAGAEAHDAATLELAHAFAAAAAAAFAHQATGLEHRRAADQNAALARAAKALNESSSLDLSTLLARICEEAADLIAADSAVVYRVTAEDELTVEAAHGLPPEHLGTTLAAGAGLAGKVLEADKPMMTEDYAQVGRPPAGSPWVGVEASVAVPVHWGGQLRGVLSVAYWRPTRLMPRHMDALEAFAELAAVAFQNAHAHAILARAALTDPLTGCLNHAALHEGLARELDRAERAHDASLSLILIDLDRFKAVNDEHGHLMGDEVLRRVGHALRSTTRPYDLAARYGGDEFALIAVEADESQAVEIAARAIERISLALGDLTEAGVARATAGVAEWSPGLTPGDLIARADRALLYGKRADRRGEVLSGADLPSTFLPARADRRDRRLPLQPPAVISQWAPRADDDAAARLRKRTRQLAIANQLGARLAAMTDVSEIHDAVVEELHEAFGYFLCAVIRIREDGDVESAAGRGEAFVRLGDVEWRQPFEHGLIGRCLRTRRPVRTGDVYAEPDYQPTPETAGVRSELCVPLWVDGELFGRDQRGERRGRRVRRRRRAAAADRGRPGRRRDALGGPLRAARARLPRHRGGARRRAGGQGRVHGRPCAHDRRAGRGGRPPAGHGRGPAARPPARRRLPRHRQDRGARVDPQQARPAHVRRARADGAPHGRGRADPRARGVPRGRLPPRAPRARALGRRGLSGRPLRPGDPARLADHPRLRRVPRDDVGPPVPARAAGRDRPLRAAPPCRHAVRSAGRRRAARRARRAAPGRHRAVRIRVYSRSMFLFREKAKMIDPERALPGRDTPLPVPARHEVLGTPLEPPFPAGSEQLVLGLGCFWGAERLFWQLPGVYTTAVGYAGGYTPNPTYDEVCSGSTGHTEAVLVVFDPEQISRDEILRAFWEGHNPTQGMRQGNDVGTQYRSSIYYGSDEQRAAIEASRDRYQASLTAAGLGEITTEIAPATPFYYAEGYHQQYLDKHPNGYCGLGGTGVSCPIGRRRQGVAAERPSASAERLRSALRRGGRVVECGGLENR